MSAIVVEKKGDQEITQNGNSCKEEKQAWSYSSR